MKIPILYDSHMHTPLCKHSQGTIDDYASVAEKRGLKGIIITCHNPGPDGWSANVRMGMAQFEEYVDMVQQAQQAWQGRVDIRLGLECDFMPGLESWLEPFLAQAYLSYVLGSVHPQLPYYKEAHFHGDILQFQKMYFQHQAAAAESGMFNTLAHPDLVKNVFPDEWDVTAVLDEVRRSLDRIAKTDVAMELNTSGLNKEIKEMNPSPLILEEMSRRNIPVVLGSDSHSPNRVGAEFERALRLLGETGHTHVHFYPNQGRHQVSLEEAIASLAIEPTPVST